MLARSTYDQAYIDGARADVLASLTAWRDAGVADAAATRAFLEGIVLRLEHAFVHRLRAAEGRDGNPLNEVRVLADSLLRHGGVLVVEKTIRLDPATSVLGSTPGERIELDEPGVTRLAEAYLDGIAATYAPTALADPAEATTAPAERAPRKPKARKAAVEVAAEDAGAEVAAEDAGPEDVDADAGAEVAAEDAGPEDVDAEAEGAHADAETTERADRA
jgi:hypothetical protein